jgi:hypothetical protein
MKQEHNPGIEDKSAVPVSKRSVLLVATFAAFLTPFMGSAVNLALPSIGIELNASAIGLGWVISSFILSSAVFLLPFGHLADIKGRKKIFFTRPPAVHNIDIHGIIRPKALRY